jgi:hypothetical protein
MNDRHVARTARTDRDGKPAAAESRSVQNEFTANLLEPDRKDDEPLRKTLQLIAELRFRLGLN